MISKPKVSVITIFYNTEKFIEEAIQSVIDQTYPNWELILVDDGSNDCSTLIAKKFADKYPNCIRYLEHPQHINKGMSASRNLGIQNSNGEFICLLDADDVYLPEKLEKQVEVLNNISAPMVYGSSFYWYSWNPGTVYKDFIQTPEIKCNEVYKPKELLKLFLTKRAAVPSPCSIMIRKDVIESIGGFEEEFRGMHEDQVFYAKASLASDIYVIKECYQKYRQHDESCYAKAKFSNSVLKAEEKYLDWLIKYLKINYPAERELLGIALREKDRLKKPKIYNLYRRSNKIIRKIKNIFYK